MVPGEKEKKKISFSNPRISFFFCKEFDLKKKCVPASYLTFSFLPFPTVKMNQTKPDQTGGVGGD
jgi:hypothetical protein